MQGLISSRPTIFERDEIVISKLIQRLERGKKSADMMRNIILEHYPRVKLEGFNNNNSNNNQDYLKALDHYSMLALDSYVTSLSMLKTCNIEHVSAGKRKLRHVDSLSGNTSSSRRDCYKRRRNGESKEEVADMTDDGYGWRKYGQKNIQNYTHPRNYYRCTHKEDLKCQATKQVQQISNNPAKYKIIYHGNHICNNNIQKTTPFIIDSREEQSSAIVISFDQSDKVDPLLFPSSAFPPPVRRSLDYSAVSPSSDDQTPTTSSIGDSTNPVSEISVFDNCSSSVAMEKLDEDYSSIMADDFSGLLPDWWTC